MWVQLLLWMEKVLHKEQSCRSHASTGLFFLSVILSVCASPCHVQKNRREVTVVVYASAGEVTPPLSSGTSCATAAPQPDAVCRPSCQSHRTGSILNPRTLSSALRLPLRRQRHPVCRRTSIRSFPRPHKARETLSAAVPTAPLLTEDGGRVPRSGRSVRRLHTVHRTAKRSRQ